MRPGFGKTIGALSPFVNQRYAILTIFLRTVFRAKNIAQNEVGTLSIGFPDALSNDCGTARYSVYVR